MPKANLLILSKVKTTRNSRVAKGNPNTIAVTPRVKESIAVLQECADVQPIYTGETKNEQYQQYHTRIRTNQNLT